MPTASESTSLLGENVFNPSLSPSTKYYLHFFLVMLCLFSGISSSAVLTSRQCVTLVWGTSDEESVKGTQNAERTTWHGGWLGSKLKLLSSGRKDHRQVVKNLGLQSSRAFEFSCRQRGGRRWVGPSRQTLIPVACVERGRDCTI